MAFGFWHRLQKQRMSKFKMEATQEQRRSLQQRNYDVSIMNTLQKCTQIIRQDRLFLRNQIINGNLEVIDTIKKFAKPTQLQNLQIKLRKYMQNVKNKMKSQQLQNFKQTLKMNATMTDQKRENNQLKTSFSTSKHPLWTQSSEIDRSSSTKNFRSQDHHEVKYQLNTNNSLKHFQELLKLKYSQEVIEQRQSQNVTSARQGRQSEDRKVKPLQQQLFASIDNQIASKINKSFIPHKNQLQKQHHRQEIKTNKQLSLKPLSWQFQKKAKQVLYKSKNNESKNAEKDIPKGYCKNEKRQQVIPPSSLEDSIYNKHFNDSNSSVTQNQQNSLHIQPTTIPEFKTLNQSTSAKIIELHDLPLVPSNYESNRLEYIRKSEEDLFTPPDLLSQCRNFLKQRENSNSKVFNFIEETQKLPQVTLNKSIEQTNLMEDKKCVNILKNFSIEQFIECLMEISKMEPFISIQSLWKFVNLHQNSDTLKIILQKQLQQIKPSQICLTKIAQALDAYYLQNCGTAYSHQEKQIDSVYYILDIDQKGYICRYDIQSFLEQLQAAQVANYNEVCDALWRLFNGADFGNEHRITYWHFYLIKNSVQFEKVKQLLDDFDFEIDRND